MYKIMNRHKDGSVTIFKTVACGMSTEGGGTMGQATDILETLGKEKETEQPVAEEKKEVTETEC